MVIASVSELIVSNLPLILTGVFAGFAALMGLFIAKRKKKKGEDDIWVQIMEAFATGVSDSQEEVVTFAKRVSADGKLTKDERKEAVKHAMKIAKEVAVGEAGRRIAKMGLAEGRKLVGRILTGRKKVMAETNAKVAETKASEAAAKAQLNAIGANSAAKPETVGEAGGTDDSTDS